MLEYYAELEDSLHFDKIEAFDRMKISQGNSGNKNDSVKNEYNNVCFTSNFSNFSKNNSQNFRGGLFDDYH